MQTLVSVGAALLGTVVGAVIAWLAGRRQHRLETAFAMHREFHAPEMTCSRNLGGKTVRKHRSDSFEAMRTGLAPEETQHVWNVMYFYQRLWLAIKYKNIRESYVPEMFGENFCWWYDKSYKDQLVPLDWQAGRHIAALMNWIGRHTDEDELARWRERARRLDDPWREETDEIGST
jgi:hypothetical protein